MLPQQSNLGTYNIQSKIDDCITILTNFPIDYQYHYQSPKLKNFYQNFKLDDYGAFHRKVMLKLINDFKPENLPVKIPPSIIELYKTEFSRIKRITEKDETYIFDWSNDSFAKDIGICSYRLIPAGAQVIEVSGFPRSLIFKTNKNFFKTLRFFGLGRRSFKPYFELHTHLGNLTDFNKRGWDRCYVRLGQLLIVNPHIKGILGGSWFYDPELGKVTPRLDFLRDVPCRNGAEIFFTGTEGRNSGALSKSKARLKLFEEGKFTPKSYLLIWPRCKLIKFSHENKGLLNKQK